MDTRFLFGGDEENVLKLLVVMVVQHCEYIGKR